MKIKFKVFAVASGIRDVTLINFDKKQVEVDDGDIYSFEQAKLMQFIGFQDKRGNDIYAKYILRIDPYIPFRPAELIGIVKCVYGRLVLQNGKRLYELGSEDFINSEIIGNFYENPDLLVHVEET